MWWRGIWQVWRRRGVYRILQGELSERINLEEIGIDKIKLLKLIFKK